MAGGVDSEPRCLGALGGRPLCPTTPRLGVGIPLPMELIASDLACWGQVHGADVIVRTRGPAPEVAPAWALGGGAAEAAVSWSVFHGEHFFLCELSF